MVNSPFWKSAPHMVYDLNFKLFIYKCLNYNYFPELSSRIQRNSEYHDYNTRGRDLYGNVDKMSLRICQRSFMNYGINIWNSLTPEIKHINSIHRMKNAMKVHLLSFN